MRKENKDIIIIGYFNYREIFIKNTKTVIYSEEIYDGETPFDEGDGFWGIKTVADAKTYAAAHKWIRR